MGPKAGGMRINFRPGRAARWSSASILERRHRLLSVEVIGQPSAPSPAAARSIARMPALTDPGRLGQASMMACRSGSSCAFFVSTAPAYAPVSSETSVFPGDFGHWHVSTEPKAQRRLGSRSFQDHLLVSVTSPTVFLIRVLFDAILQTRTWNESARQFPSLMRKSNA